MPRRPCRCVCGAAYDDMRTGMTFTEVKRMMFVHNDDPSTWRYRRRHSVLGYWHMLKLSFWYSAHDACEAALSKAG